MTEEKGLVWLGHPIRTLLNLLQRIPSDRLISNENHTTDRRREDFFLEYVGYVVHFSSGGLGMNWLAL